MVENQQIMNMNVTSRYCHVHIRILRYGYWYIGWYMHYTLSFGQCILFFFETCHLYSLCTSNLWHSPLFLYVTNSNPLIWTCTPVTVIYMWRHLLRPGKYFCNSTIMQLRYILLRWLKKSYHIARNISSLLSSIRMNRLNYTNYPFRTITSRPAL